MYEYDMNLSRQRGRRGTLYILLVWSNAPERGLSIPIIHSLTDLLLDLLLISQYPSYWGSYAIITTANLQISRQG